MAIGERDAESESSQFEDPVELTDAELLAIFTRQQDSAAFTALVNRHYGLVLGVAKRTLGCPHAAEDVVQATFIVLAKNAGQIRKRDSLASWLYGVAFRISARTARQRAKSTVSILDEDVMVNADPLEQLTAQCEQNSVLEELNRLPTKIRACMVLRYLQGKSNLQVAEEMSLSESAVEGRLKRGRNQLRLRLARQGIGFVAVVALLETMRQEAVATVVPEAVAQAITLAATTSTSPSSSIDGAENEAIRLAEQEMIKMVTSKIIGSVLATALAVGVVTTGWNLAGGAIALAQNGAAPRGNGNGTIVVQSPNAKNSSNSLATNPFNLASAGAAAPNPIQTRQQKLRALGYFSVDGPSATEERILTQLRATASFRFDNEPLSDVCDFIKEKYGIPVVIDEVALVEESIEATSEPVTIDVEGISLRNALDLTLDKLGLDAVMHKEVLFVTTKDMTDGMLVTRVYPLPSSWSITEDQLMESIISTVGASSWEEVGGAGTIISVTNGLVVSNTVRVHEEINKLFSKLENLYEPGKKKLSPPAKPKARVRNAPPTAPGSSSGDDPFGPSSSAPPSAP